MSTKKNLIAAISSLIIGTISLTVLWYLLGRYELAALRLFSVWVLGLSALYFLVSALYFALTSKDSGKKLCPMLEGMVFLGFLLVSIMRIMDSLALPELDQWLNWIICGILPILIFIDWIFFAKKGYFRAMYPFYWVALPVCYAATMIFTAIFLPNSTAWRYPLAIFNYQEYGLDQSLQWACFILLINLTSGYIFFILDFAASGKLAKKVVLPHIRTVIVDENGKEIADASGKLSKNK